MWTGRIENLARGSDAIKRRVGSIGSPEGLFQLRINEEKRDRRRRRRLLLTISPDIVSHQAALADVPGAGWIPVRQAPRPLESEHHNDRDFRMQLFLAHNEPAHPEHRAIGAAQVPK